MKKINWEYDIPKLRKIFIAITVIVWILVHALQWTAVNFVSEVMIGLVCVSAAVPMWIEKKRGSAIFWFVMTIGWFLLAIRSYFRYNM